ncbi:Retrovirus-related Pol polyprotein from transposon TNT 1-94 [Vitis vinifera]|uniref:Retrovirus-related Pol polyprotein from transposon TNT 1-94 n=1 Tax=Vitis vinifera TaxID=29760 RepID=A0A438D633_VITVI|nr:Retrovirus-related Pol polyprotein from transposon TNT 1-94 [Vitis vinifera]
MGSECFSAAILRKFGVEADIGSLPFNQICLQEAETLELPFTEGEVQTTLMEMNGDKAAGPNGFSLFFWQRCWDFVKEEILEMFKEFHDQNMFLKSINNTFLVLIPKKGGAEDLGDFRPISLLGVSISCWQSQVLSYGEWNTSWFLFKLKRVTARGLPVPLPFCHGDGSVEPSLSEGLWRGALSSGCKIQRGRGRAAHVAHLLFADDTIVFCEAKKEYLTNLSWILFWFEAASGLRINLAKSEIIPVGEVQGIEELAMELGRENEKEACPLEESIYFNGRENHTNQEHNGVTWRGKLILLNGKWCGDKENGGLGIRKFALMNKALLGKWTWRFASDKETLWKQVLVAKYGQEDHGWRTKKVVALFKGSRISTSWQPIRNALVEDMWDQNVGEGGWNLRFIRDFNDWGGGDEVPKIEPGASVNQPIPDIPQPILPKIAPEQPVPSTSQSKPTIPTSSSTQHANNIELHVYSRRKRPREELEDHTILEQNQESNPRSESPSNSIQETKVYDTPNDLYMPIALRKGVRSCTQHPISNFISYDRLSSKYHAFVTNLSNIEIPRSIREALENPDWGQAVDDEIRVLKKNGTWKLLDLPKGKQPVGCKWIFTVKYKSDGRVERYKTRLVAKGFTQTYGIDYKRHLPWCQTSYHESTVVFSSQSRLDSSTIGCQECFPQWRSRK